ncbi:hypothetical protein B0H19DRAFT_1103517 [Mycena capillaripes]|nr:hypothetical protein B0H19DRAFT_1103517 [Mycena capillaripes]
MHTSVEDSHTPMKVDTLWFSKDTTIVVRAENKMFQVSGAVLAARSTVFRDMIAFPQPMGGNLEKIDGCPVVRLHDPAEDVEVFLRAIFDSSYFMPAPAPSDLSVVLGILRLSHKYDVQYLYRRALDHLAVDGWYRKNYEQHTGNRYADHLIDIAPDAPTNALFVIITALEVGAQWLLPWAYFALSTWHKTDLLPLLEGKMEPHVVKALAARADLVRGTIEINRFLTTYNPCGSASTCDVARKSALSTLLDNLADSVAPITAGLEKDALDALKSLGMCVKCREAAKNHLWEASSAFWDEIPSFFGLPPWKELHAMERAAMEEETRVTS